MTRFQYLLIKLAEEAGEVAKEALKTAQFGVDSYNPHDPNKTRNEDKLTNELIDVHTILLLLEREYGLTFDIEDPKHTQAVLKKISKIDKYYKLSLDTGYITGM